MPTINLLPLALSEPPTHLLIARLWSAAMGPGLAITPRGVAYYTLPTPGVHREGRLAQLDGAHAGFVIAEVDSAHPEGPSAAIIALAVDPRFQRRGAGSALLDWAETWLAGSPVHRFQLGGGERYFIPGLPAAEASLAFFEKRGYHATWEPTWDMGRSLKDYGSPRISRHPAADVHPLQAAELNELYALLSQDFGFWERSYRAFLSEGGRLSDLIVLRTQQGMKGMCWTTFEDSYNPIEHFFPNGMEHPWGHLGSIGIAADSRGLGLAGVMIDYALRRLQSLGVDGCIIDWTELLDFYAKFGFKPYRQYLFLGKEI
jgi:GNAT superfamily N-acetyltransferase